MVVVRFSYDRRGVSIDFVEFVIVFFSEKVEVAEIIF